MSGAGIDVAPKLPKCPVPVWMSYRTYRSVRYRYGYRTELTKVSGTGIDVVPNMPNCPVPVLMSHRAYRNVWYRFCCRTELTEVCDKGVDVVRAPVPVPVQTWVYIPAVYVQSIWLPAFHGVTYLIT